MPLIVNCARGGRGNGFFQPHLGDALRWAFVDADPQSAVERWVKKPNLARLRAGWQTAGIARRQGAQLVVSHDPRVSFSCAYCLEKKRYPVRHLAFAFNFPALPRPGWNRRQMTRCFASIDRFLVYSTMEKQLYHEAFDLPLDRIDFLHWGVNPPAVEQPQVPLEQGDYICALGGNGRDYRTLVEAVRKLPDVRLVLVARPHNLVGLDLPANVKLYVDIPFGRAMNLLKFSQFMVLPLAGSEVPCGHVTLVNAMHLGKAFVISNSTGVRDYVQQGVNALACEAHCVDGLVAAIEQLRRDRELCKRLGASGMAFAAAYCSEASTLAYFRHYLEGCGLLSGVSHENHMLTGRPG